LEDAVATATLLTIATITARKLLLVSVPPASQPPPCTTEDAAQDRDLALDHLLNEDIDQGLDSERLPRALRLQATCFMSTTSTRKTVSGAEPGHVHKADYGKLLQLPLLAL